MFRCAKYQRRLPLPLTERQLKQTFMICCDFCNWHFYEGAATWAIYSGRGAELAAAHCYAVLVRILLCLEINLLLLIVLCACLARRKGVITHVINATQFASALSHGPRCRIAPHTQTINRKRERERTQRRRSRMGRSRGGVAILCLSHNSLAQRLEWPRALVKAGEREKSFTIV